MWQIIGHEWAVDLLASSLAGGHLSHAYLFVGPPGVGKTTLALNFAQAILCTGSERPCQTCVACRRVANAQHPDVRLVEPEGATFKISQVRELQREASLAPHSAGRRIYIVSQAERMSSEAANALLKTLEEPPDPVILILTASDVKLLPPTIVSRCQVLNLRPVPSETLRAALVEQGADEAQAELLARISGGRAGWAVTALRDPALLQKRREGLEQLVELIGADLVTRWERVARFPTDREKLRETLDLWMGWWHDMLLIAAGQVEQIANLDHSDLLLALTARCPTETTRRFLGDLVLAARRLGQNANTRLLFEVLTMNMPVIATGL